MMVENKPSMRTTVVGSYPVPEWLIALPSQEALIDATKVVFKIQELAGIDVVADGELYRWDVNHPDTNGMGPGLGVIDIKVNTVETLGLVTRRTDSTPQPE